MELFIFRGTSQLASIDFDCLRTVTYIKIHGAPVTVHTNGNPFYSPNGFLPYMKCETGVKIAGYHAIIEYLQSNGYGKSSYLHSSHICELESKLLPYLKYAQWGDPIDAETTRMTYAKHLPCPFNFIYPPRYKEQALKFLQEVANFSIDDKVQYHNTTDLIFNAKKMINTLAERIDTKLWFFDNSEPNEVDANIYAMLAILLNAQLSSNDIKNHIGANANLLKYIERIRSKYLSDICAKDIVATNEKTSLFGRVKNVFVNKEEGTVSNTTIKIIFTALTLGSMIVFAISHGIVEIAFTDDDLADPNELLYDEHEDEHVDDDE